MQADDRLFIPGSINNRDARIILDTGASGDFYILANSLPTFGLNPKDLSQSGEVPAVTPIVPISIFNQTIHSAFSVFEVPTSITADFDAIVGWGAIRSNYCLFDLPNHLVSITGSAPMNYDGWTSVRMVSDSPVLTLSTLENGKELKLHIDTGAVGGVRLSSDLWSAWRAAHDRDPKTLEARYNPGSGMVVQEVMFAQELILGEIRLHNVLVSEHNDTERSISEGSSAVLSLDVLEQVALLTAPQQNLVYYKTVLTPGPVRYNRLGAVFVPERGSEDLAATVLRGSPAWKAGVRNGDILISLNRQSFAEIRSRRTTIADLLSQPVGTLLQIEFRRRDRIFSKKVILQDLLFTERIRSRN